MLHRVTSTAVSSLACTEGYVEAYSARAASSAHATFIAVTGLACAAVSLPTVALPLKAFSEDSPQAISFDY